MVLKVIEVPLSECTKRVAVPPLAVIAGQEVPGQQAELTGVDLAVDHLARDDVHDHVRVVIAALGRALELRDVP